MSAAERVPGRDEVALVALAAAIDPGEYLTQLFTPLRGRVGLSVRNRNAGQLAETIYAAPDETGAWFFWWGWTEPFAAVSDPVAAAAKVMHVLRAISSR